jgi:omega-6 fatty acid desaturase (delta-12 desaturase)
MSVAHPARLSDLAEDGGRSPFAVASNFAGDARPRIMAQVAKFQDPSPARSTAQALSTFLLHIGVLTCMYAAFNVSIWLTLLLAPLAAGLMVRIFVIQHDCGHGSLFRTRQINDWVGRACSLVTLTPFANWRRQHAGHHATWNNLGARAGGADIYSSCLTVAEYEALPLRRRLLHRVAMHPLVAQLLIPPVVFLVLYRLPFESPSSWRRERIGVWLTNLSIATLYGGLAFIFGLKAMLVVQLPVAVIASIIGVWLFSVQHRFENARWLSQEEWVPLTAAIDGCSYLKLPRVLQWFTGSIGYHHIHHLAPRVPNYRLQDCHEALPELADAVTTLTFWKALTSWRYALWDESSGRMVNFTT